VAKVALVTGASSGIGEATAKRLLASNFIVYAGARRVDRMAALADEGARIVPLDLTVDDSIARAIGRIHDEHGRIDLLVNNAGYASYGAVEDVPMSEARRQFEVNVFGLARLIQLVIPAMRAQGQGRIINVSSMGGRGWDPLGAWYHATKFAVEGFSDSLRMELAPFGIKVVVIQPGATRTGWTAIALETLAAASGGTAYASMATAKRRLFLAAVPFSSHPDVIARVVTRAATVARPRTRYAVGAFAKPWILASTFLPARLNDSITNVVTALAARLTKDAGGRTRGDAG